MPANSSPARISNWLPWPLALLYIGLLASISSLGPILGAAAVVSSLFYLTCLCSMAGFTVLTIVMSQISDIPGLAETAVFALKWTISGVALGLVISRFAMERRRFDFRIETPERLLLLIALWGCVCSVFAVHKLSTFIEALRIAVYPALVLIVRGTLRTRRDIILAVLAYGVASAIGMAYSIVGPNHGLGRFEGLSGNANSFGLYLSFAVPVLAAGFFACRGFILRMTLLGSVAFSSVALFLSWSRASLLSLIVQGIVASLLFKRFRMLVASGLIFLTLVIAVIATPSARDLVVTVFRLQSGSTHRTVVWNAGVHSALRSPFVGHGSGLQVGEVAPDVAWGDWGQAFAFKSADAPFLPHNLFIHMALFAGLPGLMLLALMIWVLCRRHMLAGRAAASRELRIANYTIVAMIFGALANGMFESAALIGKGAVNNYFWIAVGIVAAYERIERNDALRKGPELL